MRITKAKMIHTGNFRNPWTWFTRTLLVAFSVVVLVMFPLEVAAGPLLKVAAALLFSIFIYALPVNDLAIDDIYLYDLQRSLFPFLSKAKRCRISEIASLKFARAYEDRTDVVVEFLGLPSEHIIAEIIFSDNSSTSIRLRAYKNDVVKISRRLYAVKNAARVGTIR